MAAAEPAGSRWCVLLVGGEADRLVTGLWYDLYVSQRAKLSLGVVIRSSVLASAVCLSSCAADQGKMTAVYDPSTRDLIRLDYDVNNDGRVDVRTFMANGRPVRLEGDQDGDGRLDRWEYYDQTERLIKLGTSTERDGIEDTWLYQAGDTKRVETATARDGVVDRWEFYQGSRLTRVEMDTNKDGRVDHWEHYVGGKLTSVQMDDPEHPGRPVRRLLYGTGDAPTIETDEDGDGVFVPVTR